MPQDIIVPRRCNAAGQNLIKHYEGLRLSAYKCPAGFWTVGYGHTQTARPGLIITESQANELLRQDLHRFERSIEDMVRVDLTDNQFAALVSFVFNVGAAAFSASTLRRLLNRGWYSQVPAQLMRWTKANGRELRGLVTRRAAEADLWLTPNTPQTTPTERM